MDIEENNQQSENFGRHAIEILKALSHFEYPTDVSQVEDWLNKIKPLQSILKKLCENDESGELIVDCVNVLYDLLATRGETVSPAVWNFLEIVDETEVPYLVENFLKDSTSRLKNVLSGLICGVYQCGHRVTQIQTWCCVLIKGLEDKQRYSVLRSVYPTVIYKLLHGLVLPHARKLSYPLCERILYPTTHSNMFKMVLDEIPEVLTTLKSVTDEESKEICYKFCGLVQVLMDRFPPASSDDKSYARIKTMLNSFSEKKFTPPANVPVWVRKPKNSNNISNLLECPVCYDRFVTPIMICENGHCICSNCRQKLKTCPTCRASFSNIRITIMDQIIEMTEFHCKNFDSGCDVKLLYKDIWDHEAKCEYRTVSCGIVTLQNPAKLVCNEEIVVAYFHKHIEKCHKSFVTKFELNCKRKGELKRQRTNEIRLLKNTASNLYFIERIYVNEEDIFFSYYYVGKNEDAKNYIYTINISGNGFPQKIRYSNFCLPNYMKIFETEVNERCLILEQEKIFDPQQTKFEYSVKIEDVNAYRLKFKKNKFVVSI